MTGAGSSEGAELPLLAVHIPSIQRGKRTVLSDLRFELRSGEVLFVIGRNGSGKSTLIDACLDLVPNKDGAILYAGRPLTNLPHADRPRFMALVGREESDALGFTAREVLSLASPHSPNLFEARLREQRDGLGLGPEFLSRKLAHLSQGERQRVHLLRGFLQGASVLFWDEATAHLDLAHREEALRAVRSYAAEGHAAVVVVHEIELALRYASRVLVLHEGKPAALGSPETCLTRELLRDVFELDAEVVQHEGRVQLRFRR